jgi:hypothetical protein
MKPALRRKHPNCTIYIEVQYQILCMTYLDHKQSYTVLDQHLCYQGTVNLHHSNLASLNRQHIRFLPIFCKSCLISILIISLYMSHSLQYTFHYLCIDLNEAYKRTQRQIMKVLLECSLAGFSFLSFNLYSHQTYLFHIWCSQQICQDQSSDPWLLKQHTIACKLLKLSQLESACNQHFFQNTNVWILSKSLPIYKDFR